MPSYIQGNLAIEERKPKVTRVRETTKVVYRKKAISTQEKLLYLFTIAVCVFVAGVIIFRYAQIYEMNVQLQKIDKQIQTLKAENSKMKLKLEELASPSVIEKKARDQGYVSENENKMNITSQKETARQQRVAMAQ